MLDRFLIGFMVRLISFYQQVFSPFIPTCCRFFPSCSEFSKEAFHRHGLWKGAYFIFKRLGRCHPWCEGGYDPVP